MLQNIGLVVAAIVATVIVAVTLRYFSLWFRGWVTRAGISLPSLVFMSLRGVNPAVIVDAQVLSVQAGLVRTPSSKLEGHYLAGGNVLRLARALIAAQRARIELSWDAAAAIDLAGRDVLEAVQVSVNPIVIACPDPDAGRPTLDAVARDGVQLQVRVLVTVRTNLAQLIGGATERTIVARVGEGIVSAIGSCQTYTEALRNPLLIAQQVLRAGLDAQTAFELVSVDIADITVGANIGARLQMDQAEADVRVARALAEQRRAMAVARHQEMVALTVENQATLVQSEAAIPPAIADAFRAGNTRRRASRGRLPKDRLQAFPVLRRSVSQGPQQRIS